MPDDGVEVALAEYKERVSKYDDSSGIGRDTNRIAKRIKKAIDAEGNHSCHGAIAKYFSTVKCPTLYIEWMLETYWGNVAREAYPTLIEIYDKLVADNHTRENRFEFNDMDNHIWYVPCEDKKVFIHTCQNYNHIFILGELSNEHNFGKYHIRQYWEDLKCPDVRTDKLGNQFHKEEESAFKSRVRQFGRRAALAESNLEQYSDCVPNQNYPKRPNLDYFVKNGFTGRYSDGRDLGYIMTYDRMTNRVDWAIHQHGALKGLFECYIPSMHCCLFEHEHEDEDE